MRNNLNKMFENQNELDSMDEKSGRIRSTAETFQLNSARLEKIARQRRMRAYIILVAMILSFLLLLYLIIS